MVGAFLLHHWHKDFQALGHKKAPLELSNEAFKNLIIYYLTITIRE
jgi:hypothetical protein